jgi:hypothetical protein
MNRAIVAIVEGEGEQKALPGLINRVIDRLDASGIHVVEPLVRKRQKVVKDGELEEAIQLAIRRGRNVAAILILLDADDDCPATLAPELLDRAKKETHLPVAVVMAKREFEAWFLGSVDTLRDHGILPVDAAVPERPEEVNAKSKLKQLMVNDKYKEVIHQAALSRMIDFDRCRERCPSFDKFLRDVEALVRAVAAV